MEKYDFSGWATRNDLLCSDGRTIRKDAFKHCDGKTVPLVWNHNHSDPDNVLGHALLENRNEGVYAYCSFNNTENAKNIKEAVRHGDVRSLSIFANQLKQAGSDVIHGAIREVSLVLAGANPGAFIDSVMAHGDGVETGIILGYDENITVIQLNKLRTAHPSWGQKNCSSLQKSPPHCNHAYEAHCKLYFPLHGAVQTAGS